MSEWNPLSTYFKSIWFFLKERVGASMRKTSYICVDKAVNQLTEKICNTIKNHYCEVSVCI